MECSKPTQVESVAVLHPAQSGLLTDHSAIIFHFKTSVKATPKLNRTVYDYKRADFVGLRTALQAVNLSSIVQSAVDINLCWLEWKDTFLAAVADFIPTKRIKGRSPVEYPYQLKNRVLTTTSEEKDLGVWVTSNLTWSKHVLDCCAKANNLLGFLRRCSAEIRDRNTRRILYLSLVRPALGYASQVWSPQTIDLIKRIECVQRRASKFILNLPFMCNESYLDRLISINLLPISYWHEYLDITFFYKTINGLYRVCRDVVPVPVVPLRLTRSTSNPNATVFRPRKCRTLTFQRSYFVRNTRIWNSLPENVRSNRLTLHQFKTLLLEYYSTALRCCYDVDDARTWKTICLKCNTARSLASPITCCN